MSEFLQKYRWCQAERIKGLSLNQTGNKSGGVICLKNAANGLRELYETTKDPAWSGHILHDLGVNLYDLSVFHYESGNMLAAQSYAQDSLEIWRKIRTNYLELAKLLNMVGYLRYQCGEYQVAWEAFREAKETYELLEKDVNYVHFL
ncbi:tetratricopeptide repeat protein, partial [bacterium]|nr:tetratricopeptide repeat protein [bacterium]